MLNLINSIDKLDLRLVISYDALEAAQAEVKLLKAKVSSEPQPNGAGAVAIEEEGAEADGALDAFGGGVGASVICFHIASITTSVKPSCFILALTAPSCNPIFTIIAYFLSFIGSDDMLNSVFGDAV